MQFYKRLIELKGENKMDVKEILEIIAKDNNTTPEAVEEEMRSTIREAMKTNDPKAKMLWKELSPDGKEPSLEKFFQFAVDKIKEEREKYRYN